jgi:hypothetical protein
VLPLHRVPQELLRLVAANPPGGKAANA